MDEGTGWTVDPRLKPLEPLARAAPASRAGPEEPVTKCPKCGGWVIDSTCLACDHSIAGPEGVTSAAPATTVLVSPSTHRCSRCSAPVATASRFCDRCGEPVSAAKLALDRAKELRIRIESLR